MQQLTRSHRRHTGPLTQRAWISRQDGSVTQQTIRTRPGYEETQWTIIETGEDIYLQQNPNPHGPSMHATELEAIENAMERIQDQEAHLHALYSSLDERRMDLLGVDPISLTTREERDTSPNRGKAIVESSNRA